MSIVLKNVEVHNLKKVNLSLPIGELIAFTGVSGSGKSSLAFETIYIEGQRRYIESLSPYARRHLGDFTKPKADQITGLAPTIAIEQKTMSKNPRSTVGTLTGIYDFLRVLFARVGSAYCPISLEPVEPCSKESMLQTILQYEAQTRMIFLAPYATDKKGSLKEEFLELQKRGFTKARVNGSLIDLEHPPILDQAASHNLEVVIDRIVLNHSEKGRLLETLQASLEEGNGICILFLPDLEESRLFSEFSYSPKSGISYPPLDPSDFSFNHPKGMCPSCEGLGMCQDFDITKIIDIELSIASDCCFVASSYHTTRYGNIYRNLAEIHHCDVETPWKSLPASFQQEFLYGTKQKWTKMEFSHPNKPQSWTEYVHWRGVLAEAKERYLAATSSSYKKKLEIYFHEAVCSSCLGSKLKPYPSAAKLGGLGIAEITKKSIKDALVFFSNLCFSGTDALVAKELLKEIKERLLFLDKVGLGYLSLDRTSPTLSGGEGQRVRLASQIGSGITSAIYILDEPSIGLHPKDNQKLLDTLVLLRNRGNTVIVVEHDEDTLKIADHIVDIGPLAGSRGGEITFQGNMQELFSSKHSLTGQYLSGRLSIPIPKKRRKPQEVLLLEGVCHHNLKNVTLKLPLHLFVAITGVSGSGKSSLIIDTLYPALLNQLQQSSLTAGKYSELKGFDLVDKVIAIDQTPIGRTPRSNLATYTQLFDEIRQLFTTLPGSLAKGFSAGRFSFNVKEGCCSHCEGMGMVQIDMDFMEKQWIACQECNGKRFDEETLSIRFKEKTIHDILEMTVEDATLFFQDHPKIKSKLSVLMNIGLDYLKLGQPSPTLSGGEAQRIKLSKELSRPATGNTLYILDEPTTGLHFHDIAKLVKALDLLVSSGNSVIVIEHNMDLIKACDFIIDIGPEAGDSGGMIVAAGTPEKVAKLNSPTGIALHEAFKPKTCPLPSTTAEKTPIQSISIQGGSQNNLKHVSAEIPIGKITLCTGPSGSGKSSFAFDTLYAEGQRRYVDSMSLYARQFIHQMARPEFESIQGLSASIAIEQKHHAGNPRSTVGTITEIYDYLRIIYAHMGIPFCPKTGEKIESISKEYIIEKCLNLPSGSKVSFLAPIPFSRHQQISELQDRLIKQGFRRLRVSGTYIDLEDRIEIDPKQKTEILLSIDRLVIGPDVQGRVSEAIELCILFGKDRLILEIDGKDQLFYLAFTVLSTAVSYPPITPHTFSFNTEKGMCPHCLGLGVQYGVDLSKYPDLFRRTILELFTLLSKEFLSRESLLFIQSFFESQKININTPLKELSEEHLSIFLQGASHWKGLNQVLIEYAKSPKFRSSLPDALDVSLCHFCDGTRLSPLARNVKINQISLGEVCKKSLEELLTFITSLTPPLFLEESCNQIKSRLNFLIEVGLGYISLARSAPTLSGGEMQRICLSKQLGSALTGCLYVLDEPTIGLHPHECSLLKKSLLSLKNLGNTLILVEHNPLMMEIADQIIDFGPGAGKLGGTITASGCLKEILQDPNSLTGAYLSHRKSIPLPSRIKSKNMFNIGPVSLHTIQNLSAEFPLGAMTCLIGLSGSGKSTLVMEIVKPLVESMIRGRLGPFDKILSLSQNPIGTTNRADICTYTDLLTPLRHLYASIPEAQTRGLLPKHFSYNHLQGMCKECKGLGKQTVSLQFLPKIRIPCDSCSGYRLSPLSLQILFKGKHLGQILSMTVLQALEFFRSIPKMVRILESLISVGLEYLLLGQEVATLSGGEAQRLRLSCELAKRSTGKTLFLFDEPTIGLHPSDIEKLVSIFKQLTLKGNTIILISHNLDLIAQADHLIELGPEAGIHGGKIIFKGSPEELCLFSHSKTAPFLNDYLKNSEKSTILSNTPLSLTP